jgi:hypothetical protein
LNELDVHPRWYNAATTNCTQRSATERASWDWRLLLNGKATS